MLLTLSLYIIASLTILVIIWYIHYYKWMRRLKNVPGPRPLPFVGNALLFPNPKSIIHSFTQLINQYGSCIKLMIGIEPSIAIVDYAALEAVLSSTKLIEKSRHYRYLHNWLNTGLLTSTGSKWKKRRRIITPTYHFKILEKFVATFDRLSQILVDELRENMNQPSIDIYPYVTLCALDIICETAMGSSVNAQLNKTSDYVLSVKEMGRIQMDRTFSPFQQFDFLYKFTRNYDIEKKSLRVMNEFVLDVIRKRRSQFNKASKEDFIESKEKVAFLDLLLQTSIDGVPLTDEDIREEVATFMFEGHDTIASAISFALYCIAENQHAQALIVDEQVDIFGLDKDRALTYRDLSEMKYLELVIKESLRLYPSVPLFGRETSDTVALTENIILPKGFSITIYAYGIHRDPKYFPNPEQFQPERFLRTNNLGNFPYSFIPFSAGPRNCIGQKFAMLEMKATLSKVLRNFKLISAKHRLELSAETILKSANGIRIKLEEREWPL